MAVPKRKRTTLVESICNVTQYHSLSAYPHSNTHSPLTLTLPLHSPPHDVPLHSAGVVALPEKKETAVAVPKRKRTTLVESIDSAQVTIRDLAFLNPQDNPTKVR